MVDGSHGQCAARCAPYPARIALRILHLVLGFLTAFVLWRALAQAWVGEIAPEDGVAALLRIVLPLTSLLASALFLANGWARPVRALALDAASTAALLVTVFALALGPLSRDAIGLLVVLTIFVRVGPSALDVRGALAAFAIAFALYAPLASWVTVSAAPYGDQVHYLLAADRLQQGASTRQSIRRSFASSSVVVDAVTGQPVSGACVVLGTGTCGPSKPQTNDLGLWWLDYPSGSARYWDISLIDRRYRSLSTRVITGGVDQTVRLSLRP